jgi:hypothetical protein
MKKKNILISILTLIIIVFFIKSLNYLLKLNINDDYIIIIITISFIIFHLFYFNSNRSK